MRLFRGQCHLTDWDRCYSGVEEGSKGALQGPARLQDCDLQAGLEGAIMSSLRCMCYVL